MRGLLILASSLVFASPAVAEIRDVVLSQDEDTAWVQIEFDSEPATAEWEAVPGGIAVTVSGVTADVERVEPVSNSIISHIAFERGDAGLYATLTFQPGWQAGRVHVDGHRLIVRATGREEAPVSGVNAAAPARLVTPATLTTTGGSPGGAPEGMNTDSAPSAPVPSDTEAGDPDITRSDQAVSDGGGGPDILTPSGGADAATVSAPDAAACRNAGMRVADDPWDLDALIIQAGCARANGDAAQATELLERVTAMDPGRFSALLSLAEIEAEAGNRAEARALYELAVRSARTDGEAGAAMARARALAD